jgi:PH domain
MFEDRLNPFRQNISNIEALLNTYMRCGTLFREPSTIWESGLQAKWCELTNEGFSVYDTAKDTSTPKGKYILTKESRAHLGTEVSKYSNYRLFHFQIDINSTTIVHLWDNSEESRQDWLQLLQSNFYYFVDR